MKKTIIIFISIVIGLFVLIRIPINLRSNAYYYATHMPHKKNQYPFVPVLLGHWLPEKYVPGYQTKNYGATRGPVMMQVSKRNIKEKNDIFMLTEHTATYAPKEGDWLISRYGIYFDESGTYDDYSKDKGIPAYSKELVTRHLKNVQNEIKQNAPKPKVNLQWIWNVWFKIHYR
ncbi:hypothetical protein EAI26_09335 [Lactobacillus sp. 0.1XD8-4]|uniref:hypothetical protein n=1 Tax=uncultured Limosilactobacillus sp. TaxID=2837629 RepID=UPI00129ED5BD|nr:hypothetical protein [uncultured Limosilactobacillus sp.]MRN07578.1 hypothetical protein [Lactobacillus sp. 0.1XD8-4]